MEGVASVALMDNGCISGHFIHLPHSICYGIHGTGKKLLLIFCIFSFSGINLLLYLSLLEEMVCERECSRGEDYRLVKLTIIDYNVRSSIFTQHFQFSEKLTLVMTF